MPDSEEIDISRAEKLRPYLDKYEAWVEKSGLKKTPETLEKWDITHNNGRIRAKLGTVEEVLEVGYRTLYNRVFYSYYNRLVEVNPVKIILDNKPFTTGSGKFRISAVRGGANITANVTAAQRKNQIAKAEQEFLSAGRRLKLLQLPTAKIYSLLEEALS